MRCRICDSALTEVHFNSDHGDIEPCLFCQEIINDTIAGFTDKPVADEDELGSEDILSLFYEADLAHQPDY